MKIAIHLCFLLAFVFPNASTALEGYEPKPAKHAVVTEMVFTENVGIGDPPLDPEARLHITGDGQNIPEIFLQTDAGTGITYQLALNPSARTFSVKERDGGASFMIHEGAVHKLLRIGANLAGVKTPGTVSIGSDGQLNRNLEVSGDVSIGSRLAVNSKPSIDLVNDEQLWRIEADGDRLTLLRDPDGARAVHLDIHSNGNVGVATTPSASAGRLVVNGALTIPDPMTAPNATRDWGKFYVDSADGNLKFIFSDGTVRTLATNP